MSCAEVWTDHEGNVHERRPRTEATRCGLVIGALNRPRVVRACRACVADHLAEYAQSHLCVPDCREHAKSLVRVAPPLGQAGHQDSRSPGFVLLDSGVIGSAVS